MPSSSLLRWSHTPLVRVRRSLGEMGDGLLAAVLAPACAACSTPLDRPSSGPVCEVCWDRIDTLRAPLCRTCGSPLAAPPCGEPDVGGGRCPSCRRHGPTALDTTRAAGRYDGSLRHIVHAFKYEGRRTIAKRLGALVRRAGVGVLEDAACAVPVPLHPWRHLRRGFNQASDLARTLDVPVVHALWRTRATQPQTGLTAGGRHRNVRGAFAVSPLLSRATRRQMLLGRVVILVDDVRTTGATLEECARILKAHGAEEVRALTVAIADPPDPMSKRLRSTSRDRVSMR